MRAFVLSGGANYGAQQVGALEVLFEIGLQPDMIMGVSAGALNAAWVAVHPTLEGVQELARIWREDAAASVPSRSSAPGARRRGPCATSAAAA